MATQATGSCTVSDDKTIRPRDGSLFSMARTCFEAGFKTAKATEWTLEQAMTDFESQLAAYVASQIGR